MELNTISGLAIAGVICSVVLSMGVPIALFIAGRVKLKARISSFFIGAGTYLLFAMLLEQLLHVLVIQFCGLNAQSRPWLYYVYAALAAAVFEETGRLIAMKFWMKKWLDFPNALMYGIGHGGVEAILIGGLSGISNLVSMLMINSGAMQNTLAAGNILGPFQINYITVVLKVIEFPSPVRSYHQDINIILNDVIDLLSLIFFNDDLICQPRPSHILDSLNEAVPHIEFAPLNVKALTCDTYDQIITKCFCSFDNIVVAFMKKIKSAICDYSLHSFVITPLKKIFLFCRTVFLLHTIDTLIISYFPTSVTCPLQKC